MPPLPSRTTQRTLRPPVKAACLACRASKTRCDGHEPCSSCFSKGKQCSYQASRRGGPRRGSRYKLIKRNFRTNYTRYPSTPPNSIENIDNLTTLFTPSSGIQELHSPSSILSVVDSDDPSCNQNHLKYGQQAHDMARDNDPQNLTIRAYESEADIVNAYYIFIHPYLPLLPPPGEPQYEDQPVTMHFEAEDFDHPSQSSMRHWPTSPLSLALSSILVLIPAPGDVCPPSKAVFLRQKYADIYAHSALESVDKDIDLLGSTSTLNGAETHLTSSLRTPLHPNVPLKLESLLALIILSAYQYCQRGNISKMRARVNQAITTAMDMSLHSLGREAVEAERRAWWMTVHMVYMSSSLNVSSPTILIGDPRISTPYPEFQVSIEPWSLMLKAQHALFTSTDLLKGFGVDPKLPLPSLSGDQIHELDSYIETLATESDRSLPMTNPQGAEAAAAQSMWIIARLLIYTARIKLHRFRAFLDMPIFLESHCGLTSINGVDSPYATINRALSQVTVFECIFPFTEQESSSICLKSALAVARAFKTLPHPDSTYSDVAPKAEPPTETIKSSADTVYMYRHTLPYFACCAIQGCYVLLMLLYKIRASRASDHLSSCYHLLGHPGPGTEAQDFERLVEEIRNAVDSLKGSLQQNAVFEGVGRMGREIDGACCAAFPG